MFKIAISVIISLIISFICLKELTRMTTDGQMYPHVNDSDKKFIFLYPILFILLFYTKGVSMFTLSFGTIIPILITQIIIDYREQELSDLLTLIIAIIAISVIIKFILLHGYNNVILSYLGNSLILFGVYLLIAILTNGALGGGDIKLIGALGLFFPISDGYIIYTTYLLIVPFAIGAIYAITSLLFKKKKYSDSFAYGPSIIIGILCIIFYFY